MTIAPDTKAAIEFLSCVHPNGPWHLVALGEGSGPKAKTFSLSEIIQARKFIDAHQGDKNLYWHVNRLKSTVRNIKAKKENVEEAVFLHVDIDDLDALKRIEAYSPRPTATVFSGGGYQAFWRLSEPAKDLERVERCNSKIADDLGGDHCHNIDRIMRLPGTINVPNKKKRDAGRNNTLAYVVEELTDWSRIYSLDTFPEAVREPSREPGVPASQVNVPVHVDLTNLPNTVTEFTKRLIEGGDDIQAPIGSEKARYPSRSEAVFRTIVDLVRAGVAPEQIASIITDQHYRISVSVRERPQPRAYAFKQIRAAQEKLATDWPDADKHGGPRCTYRNTVAAIRRLDIVGENDEFHRRKSLNGAVMQVFQGDLSDDLCSVLRAAIIEKFGFDPGKENTIDAANYITLENSHHPIRDYLAGLEWDRVPRLGTWMIDYLSAADTPLNRAISRIVPIAAVRRIREPGVKFDSILVLEGVQGSGKSTAIQIMAGRDNFSDQDILTLDAKQQMEAMEGIWLYEISELAGLNRGETNRVKAFASRQVDRGRPAYGRFRENRPRQTVFIGTTNEDTYLRDTTGNRRFYPVKTGQIDLEALARDRDQLWAEATEAEASGESITLSVSLWSDAAAEQEARMEEHPWLEQLSHVTGTVTNNKERISTDHLLGNVLGIEVERRQQFHLKLLATMMPKLGWRGPTKFKADGKTLRGYERDSDKPDTPPGVRAPF